MSLRAQSLKDIFTFTRASTATYFDASGILNVAAVDEPRIDYSPSTHECLGLLIEEQRTNLILNQGVPGFVTQNVTVTNVPHTLSFYGTGSIALTGTASPEVSLVGAAGTTRVSLTFTPAAGTLTLTVTGTANYAQLEIGANPTSYIPTNDEAVTRARDVCTAITVSPWFNEPEGTVFTEYLIPWAHNASEAGSRRIAEIMDGSVVNRHIFAYISGGVRQSLTTAGSSEQAYFDAGAFTANVVQKQAYAWDTNDCVAYANGYTGTADTSATMPTGLTTFTLGSVLGDPNGYIRKVKFYPRRLSNSELAALVA